MIKLIVSDMDGTLLNSSKKISQSNIDAITFARKIGVKFTLATGRIFKSASSFARELNIDLPIITCNGGLIKNHITNEVLFKKVINNNVLFKVKEILEAYNLYYHLYTESHFITKELKYTSLSYWNNNKNLSSDNKIDIILVDDFSKVFDQKSNILKFVVIDDEYSNNLINAKHELQKIKEIEISHSWHNNLEIMASGISKGNALKIYAKKYNINLNNIVCIGDQDNDLSMITEAGIGIAMGNATQELKDNADFITNSNDEDGVAKAIMKILI